jgi:hypothetical protein
LIAASLAAVPSLTWANDPDPKVEKVETKTTEKDASGVKKVEEKDKVEHKDGDHRDDHHEKKIDEKEHREKDHDRIDKDDHKVKVEKQGDAKVEIDKTKTIEKN